MAARKPIWLRIIIWAISTCLSIAALLAVAGIFIYVRYQVNVIEVYKQIKILNEPINKDELITNPWTEEDLNSAQSSIDNVTVLTTGEYLNYTDRELAAYINDEIQKNADGMKVSFGSGEVNLLDYGFEIVQIRFDNIPEDATSTKLTDFNIIFKVDLTKLKKEKMESFPFNWLRKGVPDELYISSSVEVIMPADAENEFGYQLVSKGLIINNLKPEQTANIFKTVNIIAKIGSSDDFNVTISKGFIDALIGENGVYADLKTKGATGYKFKVVDDDRCFVVNGPISIVPMPPITPIDPITP